MNRGVERQSRLPISGVELVWDLSTGKGSLRRFKRRPRTPQVLSNQERTLALRGWWTVMGRMSFLEAIETWRLGQSVKLAEISGQNVEYSSGESSAVEGEEMLRAAFKSTNFKPIRVLDIVIMLKQEGKIIESNLGFRAEWVRSCLSWMIDLLAEERRLSEVTRSGLKAFINQPYLTGFS